MSRVIKFRAWTKDWDGVYRMSFSDKYEEDEIPTSAHQLMSYFFRNLNPNAELMQSTGLHDKNGKEIYEGDVIKTVHKMALPNWDGWGRDIPFRQGERTQYQIDIENYVIYYEENRAEFRMKDIRVGNTRNLYELKEHEVIGNIYQNPELLNPTKP